MGAISHSWDEALSAFKKQAETLPVGAEKIEVQAKIRCLEYAMEVMAGPDPVRANEQPSQIVAGRNRQTKN